MRKVNPNHSPRLDWLPDYDDDLIYEALQQKWDEVYWVLKIAIWWAIVTAVVFFAIDLGMGGLLAVPFAVLPFWLVPQGLTDSRTRTSLASLSSCPEHVEDQRTREVRSERSTGGNCGKAGFVVTKPKEAEFASRVAVGGSPFSCSQLSGIADSRVPQAPGSARSAFAESRAGSRRIVNCWNGVSARSRHSASCSLPVPMTR